MQILIYVVLIILISYIFYKAYLIYKADDSEVERLRRLKNKDSLRVNLEESELESESYHLNNKISQLSSFFSINTRKINKQNKEKIEQLKNQIIGEKIVNNENSESYLQALITTAISLKDFDLKDFKLYNNITLDYFDYETSKKTAIKLDNIIISPYGIITIKNISLNGLSIVDLNFTQDSKSKALQVVSNNANIKAKEYSHPVVEAINQSKALSSFFISKNIPNAFITPIVVYTNINDDYTQNKVLLKLENGEYSLLNNICKINNLLGNKNSAYIMYSNTLAPFLIDMKNNTDISRPVEVYSKEDLYNFDYLLKGTHLGCESWKRHALLLVFLELATLVSYGF